MKRFGAVIEVRKDKIPAYKKLHAAVWPDVLKMIRKCKIRNYSIYLRKLGGKYYLFSYLEYHGKDIDADMKVMAADPMTQKWWSVCKPCQKPIADRPKGAWWADMDEVFHCD